MQEIIVRLAGRVLTAPLRLTPFSVQRAALEQPLNHLFHRPVADGELDFLEGRSIVLEIVDLGWRWPITLEDGRIRVREKNSPGHAVVRGRAAAFALLAGGLADPDMLFFQRRLAVEGDTELGLALKNFLDGLDPADLPLPCIARLMRRRAVWRSGPSAGGRGTGAGA